MHTEKKCEEVIEIAAQFLGHAPSNNQFREVQVRCREAQRRCEAVRKRCAAR